MQRGVSHDRCRLTRDAFSPGWLHKEVKNSPKTSSLKLKKRWFVLTHNSLDYYKSSEKNALKLGTLVLNSLCSVVPPDEKIFKETGKGGCARATSHAGARELFCVCSAQSSKIRSHVPCTFFLEKAALPA